MSGTLYDQICINNTLSARGHGVHWTPSWSRSLGLVRERPATSAPSTKYEYGYDYGYAMFDYVSKF